VVRYLINGNRYFVSLSDVREAKERLGRKLTIDEFWHNASVMMGREDLLVVQTAGYVNTDTEDAYFHGSVQWEIEGF
jgi:hypothetical protein